ncbi:hypothetical protein K3495_g3201 [Podosphaera aphanis]|nr:hypothetical protein K3495_g3201 [Podosphaera aphanis]
MASLSGLLGGVAGNSADVLNVRMQHDASLPMNQRRNYKNPLNGFIRMTKEEGWKSHFRGVIPNSLRAALVTAAQLASYDGFKRLIVSHTPLRHDLSIQLSASCLAGFVATTVCNPVDVIKSRIMSASQRQKIGTLLADLYRLDGIKWVFRGWLPSFVRLGPHTVATLLFLEQHKNIYKKLKGVDKSILV